MTTTALHAKALYANSADTDEELSFAAGDLLTVHERDVAGLAGWWLCSHAGRIGIAPGNRLRLVVSPTTADDDDGDIVRAGSGCSRGVQTDGSVSSTVKARPATAPQHGHAATLNNASSNSGLVVPRKSGNVYVYDDAAEPGVDYDVPTMRYAVHSPGVVAGAADSSQDYDVPAGVASPCRYNHADDDVDFGVGDYDLLSPPPPPPQRPVSDVDASSSNRSSVTSVVSGGSLSSGCASVRSAHLSPTAVAGARTNGCEPQLLAAARRCVSEATSDTSADSGIALQAVLSSAAASTLNGDSVHRNGADDDCLDYDVPMAIVNDSEGADVIGERRAAATSEQRCPSSVGHVRPVIIDEPRRRDNGRCVDDVRRRRVDELRDCVLRGVQRFLAWTGRATAVDACGDAAAAARQCHGQAKLAGLAVRTSLRQLVAVVDGNPPELIHRHVDPLNKSLVEIDRRVDCLIASGGDGRSHRLAGSTTGGRRAARESTVCRERLLTVAEVVADLPELVVQFADFVATNSAVVLRPPDDVDAVPSSPTVVRNLPPAPPQRRDSRQRDKPPQSPPATVGGGGNPRARRPPIGKPPPVKPKPPKSVTWKRPPQTTMQPGPAGSDGMSNGPASRPTTGAAHERRVAELNRKNNGRATEDGWNDDDCDYVSIVREVEREMQTSLGGGKPATTGIHRTPAATDVRTSTALNDDDRELLAFFSAQVGAHAADVDAATAEFYRCCPPPSSPLPASPDAFVRRSRFVVLAAHRLVYVGDVIARHVADSTLRDRVAAAANVLCERLKAVVVATRDAAVATAENGNPAAAAALMVDSVRRATDDCHHLCNIISAAACQ